MSKEVIGSPFKEGVLQQIQARQDLFGSRSRSNDQLLYMNSRTGWVRVLSSVNTLTKQEILDLQSDRKVKDYIGSSQLAQFNILSGGTKTLGETVLKSGVGEQKGFNPIVLESYNTVKAGDSRTNLYQNYSSVGFRPEPGIESVEVKSLGTYGTLRQVDIKIVAWTLEDLEVIQALYLRPGYSVMVEWGHSLWIDNSNKSLQKTSPTIEREYFTKTLSHDALYEKIETLRKQTDYNYDAVTGYISNFSWSFRPDGGYDCTVKVISKGAILDSLTLFKNPEAIDTNPSEIFSKDEPAPTPPERRSVFHKFLIDTSKTLGEVDPIKFTVYTKVGGITANTTTTADGRYINQEDLRRNIATKPFADKLTNFIMVGFNKELDLQNSQPWYKSDDQLIGGFIPLRCILDIFNNFITVRGVDNQEKLVRFYTGQTDQDPEKGVFEKESKYITSNRHFSSDPLVCILPKSPINILSEEPKFKPKVPTVEFNLGKIRGSRIHDTVEYLFKKNLIKGEQDDVLNILVSGAHLMNLLDVMYEEKTTSQQSMFTLIKNLLADINTVLGEVNNLDLFYDEEENMYYVVDRVKTPVDRLKIKRSQIALTGLSSLVTDLNISSKISPEIAGQVSIAAQGTGDNYRDNVDTLLKWNQGLIDRHIPLRTYNNSTPEDLTEFIEQEKKERHSWYNAAWVPFQKLNRSDSVSDRDYNKEEFQSIQTYHRKYTGKYVLERYYKNPEKPLPPPGFIPVEMEFTMVGIGGLKIGQAFTVRKGVFPRQYSEVGYIITGLSHTISNNEWKTNIKALAYLLDPPTTEELAIKAAEPVYGPEPTPIEPDFTTVLETLGEGSSFPTDKDFWTLVAIASKEDSDPQGRADVAQTIYNRVGIAKEGVFNSKAGYRNTIAGEILRAGQYEPTWRYPNPKEGVTPNREWQEINSAETAARAAKTSLSNILATAQALKNPTLQRNAADFIQGRTEFLGTTQTGTSLVGKVSRNENKSNKFGWRYTDSRNTFPIPNIVNNIQIT